MALDYDHTVAIPENQSSLWVNTNNVAPGYWESNSPDNDLWNSIGYYTCVAIDPAADYTVIGTTYNGFVIYDSTFYRLPNPSSTSISTSWANVAFVGSRVLWAVDKNGTLWRAELVGTNDWSDIEFGQYPTWTSSGKLQNLTETVYLSSSRTMIIAAVRNGGVHINFTNTTTGWQMQTTTLPTNAEWSCVAMSADGASAMAAVKYGSVYLGKRDPSGTSFTWTVLDTLGSRNWSTVALSQNGTCAYAGVFSGYLYGSTDSGVTWQRDVTPSILPRWEPIRNEGWTKVLINNISDNNIGIALSSTGIALTGGTRYRLFRIQATGTNSADSFELLMPKNTASTQNWRAVACSDDGAVAVAIAYNGPVIVTVDGGETWSNALQSSNTSLTTRSWTCVGITPNGQKAIVMADTGHIAISSSVTYITDPSQRLFRNWTEYTGYVAPAIEWTAVDFNDAFNSFVATARNQGIYVSTNGTTWTRDDARMVNLSAHTSSPWSAVAMSNDGSVSSASATDGVLRVVRAGDTFYKITNDANGRNALLTNTDKFVLPVANGPDFFLASQTSISNFFSTDIYQWFLQKYKVYRVDCDLVSSLTSEFKVYVLADGSRQLATDSSLASFLIQNNVGNGNVLVATSSTGGVTRTHLIHPEFTTTNAPASITQEDVNVRLGYIVNTNYTKYIMPSPLNVVKTNITITSSNNTILVKWNNEDYTLTIPPDSYTVSTLNDAFQAQMEFYNMYTVVGGVKTYYMRLVDYAYGVTLVMDPPPRNTVINTPPLTPGGPSANVWPYIPSANVGNPTITVVSQSSPGLTTYGFGDVIGFLPGQHPSGTSKSSDFLPLPWVTTSLTGTPFTAITQIYPQIYGTVGNREPMPDYIVKESYYFAPGYDQYDTKQTATIDGKTFFQPRQAEQPQKMVNPTLGSGRYFGVAFGSFLNDNTNPSTANSVYTRGRGNAMKLYSFRPITQLYSFKTDSGFLKDKTGTATNQATFTNEITNGILDNAVVKESGNKYFSKDTTVSFIQPTLDENEAGLYYDASTGQFADTPMYLLTGTSTEIVKQASNDVLQVAQHATANITMEDDTTSVPLETFTPSSKTPLNRSAEFHFRVTTKTPIL
jgi:hypothetical protein